MYEIILLFQRATGLYVNESKSSFHYGKDENGEMEYISQLFNIRAVSIKEGFKYLGYHLKPTGYNTLDWSWIIYRFYKRIKGWECKCLSLVGKSILSQAVLAQISLC